MCPTVRKKRGQSHIALLPMLPETSAEAAELHYVRDDRPGITRKKRGQNFVYYGPNGSPIKDKSTLERIQALGIPPAYRQVWICPDPYGHLQATGRAENGKKQYIYHARWRQVRSVTNFSNIIAFGEMLPSIRSQVEADLQLSGLPRRKVMATVVRLLESTLIRIGNEYYARENDSYGLTTVTRDHVDIHGNHIRFEFKGKSGKEWSLDIEDARIAKIVKKCAALPGYELFQYIDESGNSIDVGSKDVNDYLKELTGQPITAKFFRTWAGTVAVFKALCVCEPACDCSQTQAKRYVTQAIKQAAEALGNTPAVCRKSYIHPEVLASYLDGAIHQYSSVVPCAQGLCEAEFGMLQLLKARLQAADASV